MSAKPSLQIGVTVDAGQAERELRQVGERVEHTGDQAGRGATGFGDLAGALELVGASGAAQSLGILQTALDATAGASDLFAVAQNSTVLASVRARAAAIAQTASTVALTAVQKTAAIATRAWAVVQGVLNAVMALNPIMLVVLAVVALILVLVAVHRNWSSIVKVVQACWKEISRFIGWLVKVTVTGPLKALSSMFLTIGRYIGDAAKAVGSFIAWIARVVVSAGLKTLKAVWEDITGFISGAIKFVGDFITKLAAIRFPNPLKLIQDSIKWIADKVQWILDHIGKIRLPKIPGLSAITGNAAAATGPAPYGGPGWPGGPDWPTAGDVRRTLMLPSIDVYLDGRKVTGYVSKVVQRSLDADGARLLSGAWG